MRMKFKKVLKCGACFWVWKNNGRKNPVLCPKCGKMKDARDRSEWAKQYLASHPERLEKFKKWARQRRKEEPTESNRNNRKSALLLVGNGNVKCENCGCDDVRFLEINHKNGNGNKELQKGKMSNKFYWDITMLRRKTNDLNILCKVCNNLYALEMKYGKTTYRVIYK